MILLSILLVGAGASIYAKIKINQQKVQKKSEKIPVSQIIEPEKSALEIAQNNQKHLQKKVNQKLIISLSSLGIAIFFPVLRPLSWIGLLYSSADFFKQGYQAVVKQRKLNMAVVDTVMFTGLIATGNLIAGTLMCTFLWAAQKVLQKTEDRSHKNLINIFGQQPRSVWILKQGVEIALPFEQLCAGDIVVVNAGEMIPADGVIIQGMASIDQKMLTGESQPVEKMVGDAVFAATLLLSGQLQINVEKAGTDSVAAQIAKVLEQTRDFKTATQAQWMARVDKTAPITLGVGLVAWPILGVGSAVSLLYSFNYGYSMRVIAPTTMMNFLSHASQSGILIKDGRSLELLDQVDTVIFDKTGTLTQDQPIVANLYTCNNCDENTLLSLAAAAEYRQTHPVAQAILQAAEERHLTLPNIDDAQYEVGYGIKVHLDQQIIYVGSLRFMIMSGIKIPAEMELLQQECNHNGDSFVMVARDQQLLGMIELHAVIRAEAQLLINTLKKRKCSLYILSGDHEEPTKKLAKTLGIPHYVAEILPEEKAKIVEELQQQGKTVCFIGDGINDSIALQKAHVSISMSGASNIATDTAHIILMDGSLKHLIPLFDIAQRYNKNIQKSFMITLIPSAIAVGGIIFLHFGIIASITLYYTGLTMGMANALLTQKRKK
jgi:Cu2+-exporting ATPase